MKLSKDARLTIGLIILLMLLGLATAVLGRSTDVFEPPLSSQSSEEDGAKALRLWLNELGYQTSSRRLSEFEPLAETDVILMLEPSVAVLASEARTLERWVEGGGRLLIADGGGGSAGVLGRFELGLNNLLAGEEMYTRQHPALSGAIPWETITLDVNQTVRGGRTDFVTYLALDDNPIVVGFEEGEGEVIVVSTSATLTNLALQTPENAAFSASLINLIADEGETIWFDDWHHGRRLAADERDIIGTGDWLRNTPIGQSFLVAAGIIALSVVLGGRAFGRPIPLAEDKVRRAPLEYVTAIANLNRRSGNRQAVLAEYKQRFKRDLGRRYRVDAGLPDNVYLDDLARANPDLDQGAVRDLLAKLSQSNISEGDLVALAHELASYTS